MKCDCHVLPLISTKTNISKEDRQESESKKTQESNPFHEKKKKYLKTKLAKLKDLLISIKRKSMKCFSLAPSSRKANSLQEEKKGSKIKC